jgi:UDP-N-acetylmuramoyl-L-alanyl-D-glutamate--2,6-diaminopimelate ligase
MDERSVRELLADFEHLDCIGSAEAVFSHITNHAGDCRPGSLYIALSGIHADGHQFIDEAVSLGAAVILHETPLSSINPHITYLRSSQVRTDMSHVSAWFYHTYDNPVHVIGITGTDGKTTTCYLLYQLLVLAGIRTALLSTVYADDGTGLKSNPQRLTTPEAPIIHEFLYEAHNNGVRYAVIEASSHALSHKTERLADIVFDTGLITTLSAEHLDFHGTKKEYFYDKMNLFRQLRSHNSAAVLPEKLLNRWTPHFAYHERVYSYSCLGPFRVG